MPILSPWSSVEQRKNGEQKFGQSDLVDALLQEGIAFDIEEDAQEMAKACFSWGTRSWSCSGSKCKFTE